MDEDDRLAGRFEASRPRLRAMAYRMLGSLSDAEDAVQEGWLHAAGSDAGAVANLEGWFTTIVARVCLDMLRSRKSRREDPLDPDEAAAARSRTRCRPARSRRQCSPTRSGSRCWWCSTRSRPPNGSRSCCTTRSACRSARSPRSPAGPRPRRASWPAGPAAGSRAAAPAPGTRLGRQRKVAEAFLAAARGGDLGALIAVLDPEVVLHADAAAAPSGVPVTIRGAAAVASGARAASVRSRYSRVALVNGTPGIVMAPRGRLTVVLAFTIDEDKISRIDVIADPARLAGLDLAVLDG